MIEAVLLAARLARAGGRLRTALVVAGSAVGTVVLLIAAAIPQTLVHPDQDARNFATIVILALSLPVVTLLAAVTRVSASVRDRRLAALRIIGVSAATTRAVAAIEAALLSAAGSVVGVLGFLAVRPVAAEVAREHDWFHGRQLTPSTLGAALAIGAVSLVLSLMVAVLPARAVTSSPLAVRRQAAVPRPRWWRLGPLVVGSAVLTYSGHAATSTTSTAPRTPSS